jgi:hypothetical protein
MQVKQDFPVMQAIFNSPKENAAAINAKGAAERKQADQIVDRTRQMTAATDAAIDRMRRQQLQADRSFADVDEGIRGYRKVYDTQTGQEADVNLGDVNGVVNALNEADPGRYVQVPLRAASASQTKHLPQGEKGRKTFLAQDPRRAGRRRPHSPRRPAQAGYGRRVVQAIQVGESRHLG